MNQSIKTCAVTALCILSPLSLAGNYFFALPVLKAAVVEVNNGYAIEAGQRARQFAAAPGVSEDVQTAYANDGLPQVRKIEGGF